MESYAEYWVTNLIRGFLAIVAGAGVLFIPEMASTILLLPFAIIISILCLAVYGTIDSALILITSFMIPYGRPGRVALRLQGIGGAIIGILLFVLVYDHFDFRWFLYLAAAQAAGTALAEFIVARGTSVYHSSPWCYAAAAIAAVSAIVLPFGRDLAPHELAWLLYGYLGLFGFNLFALSARMLFTERKRLQAQASLASGKSI
ncbi:hypothetical protein [Granulicella sp. dw_53]|uniref:hypothetical protein n=1 Tax=Granulicella sp. dw_53 TaxID=2719792 RepID=UPI001BD406BF|nr:hypothetical protein [Granulicella sp. dw_53]